MGNGHPPPGRPSTGAEGTIAFASDRGRDFDIYVMNADGSDVRWPREKSWDWFTSRSPDGRHVASTYQSETGNVDVYVENADGSGFTWLTDDPGDDVFGGWSPDGRRIAFDSDRDGNKDVYVMNADGSGLTRLTGQPG